MQKANARYVIIKRGEHGAYVYGEGIACNFDAPRVNALDTTAAGDAFTAALTVRMMETGNIAQAVRYANCVGALTVTRAGAQASLPASMDVEQFMKANCLVN